MSLTIEFAGVSTLLWQKGDKPNGGEATVVLVDLGQAGFHTHHATLAMEGNSSVSCPDPDTSIAVPGVPSELGIWDLRGTELEIIADGKPLEVDDSEIDEAKVPAVQAGSIRWLPEIGGLCQSRTLAPGVPIATRLRLSTGRVSATAAQHPPIRVAFDEVVDERDRVIGGERYILPRFMVEIESAKVTLRVDKKREFKFDTDHNVIISNTCVCEPPTRSGAGHFYGHYLLVEAKRKPRVRRTSGPFRREKMFSVPEAPEHCFCAYAMI